MLPVTSALIAANVAIFLLQGLLPELVIPFALWPWGASQVDPQVGFAPWQLVSYAFLHGSLLHLAFNMFALYMFGGAIERVFGGPVLERAQRAAVRQLVRGSHLREERDAVEVVELVQAAAREQIGSSLGSSLRNAA